MKRTGMGNATIGYWETKIRMPWQMSAQSQQHEGEALNEIGFPYTHKHIAYEYMSHAVLTRLPWIYKMAFKSERRHPKECAKDRDALKNELLDWVNADR